MASAREEDPVLLRFFAAAIWHILHERVIRVTPAIADPHDEILNFTEPYCSLFSGTAIPVQGRAVIFSRGSLVQVTVDEDKCNGLFAACRLRFL